MIIYMFMYMSRGIYSENIMFVWFVVCLVLVVCEVLIANLVWPFDLVVFVSRSLKHRKTRTRRHNSRQNTRTMWCVEIGLGDWVKSG